MKHISTVSTSMRKSGVIAVQVNIRGHQGPPLKNSGGILSDRPNHVRCIPTRQSRASMRGKSLLRYRYDDPYCHIALLPTWHAPNDGGHEIGPHSPKPYRGYHHCFCYYIVLLVQIRTTCAVVVSGPWWYRIVGFCPHPGAG